MTTRVLSSRFLVVLVLVVMCGTILSSEPPAVGAEETPVAGKTAAGEGYFTGVGNFLGAVWACVAAAFWFVVRIAEQVFRPVFAPINRALSAIPLAAARWVAFSYIVFGALWTFLLPRKYIYEGAPSQAWWWDLRLWAVVFLLPFALIYLLW